jgi:serine/threonine protein kinase
MGLVFTRLLLSLTTCAQITLQRKAETAEPARMNLNQNKELSANTTVSHYRIVSKLGAGGMGEVWLAEDTRLGRKVALKLLPVEFTEDSERVRRFTQEAKAASALNHPNIISVYDIGESETGRFIVMEFVAGRTLRVVIAKDNSLETFFALGAQMARALSAAHAAGITHRDIKPDNIMVRDDGYVKMLDFGLARLLPATASDPEAMTLAQQTTPGTVMGTLAYMSPEQASGQTVGSASDVFALGIVLYELATGSHPFKSESMLGYLHAITSKVPPSMTSLKSHLPAALDDLILSMLDKDANSRPMAAEVAQALNAAIAVGKRTLELDPAFPLTHQRLGLPYVQKQMYLDAIAEFQQAVNNSNRAPQPMISLGHAYAVSGNKVGAEKVLAELKDLSRARYVSPYGVAVIYVGLGDKEQAFQWLESAYDERNTELTFLQVDPRLDPLRDDAHFEALLKKVAFPQ